MKCGDRPYVLTFSDRGIYFGAYTPATELPFSIAVQIMCASSGFCPRLILLMRFIFGGWPIVPASAVDVSYAPGNPSITTTDWLPKCGYSSVI